MDHARLSSHAGHAKRISDLETAAKATQPCLDPQSPAGFLELAYGQPRTSYQRKMHLGHDDVPMDSMRMARHRDNVRERFARILAECPKGVRMNEENRKLFGLLKHRVYPMSSTEPDGLPRSSENAVTRSRCSICQYGSSASSLSAQSAGLCVS